MGVYWGPFGVPLGTLGVSIGSLWVPFGSLRGHFGGPWPPLGPILVTLASFGGPLTAERAQKVMNEVLGSCFCEFFDIFGYFFRGLVAMW